MQPPKSRCIGSSSRGFLIFLGFCCLYGIQRIPGAGDALVRGASEGNGKAALRAQLKLARLERARAEEKIRRLEEQLFGDIGTDDSSDFGESSSSSRSDLTEMLWEKLRQEVGHGFHASIRKSAQKALRSQPEPDESGKGCDWIAGIRLAWTSPPTVREVKPDVQEHFPRPIESGDLLGEIDGISVAGLNRQDALTLLANFKGRIGFKGPSNEREIRESARVALERGPQKDAQCSEGQNWIWGFLFAWTSPPVVRDVKPEVQKHFPNPVNPGDVLNQIDGKLLSGLSREEVLKLLLNYQGSIGFRMGNEMDDDVRKSAQDALQSGPLEDIESGKGCNWIGGILLAWTSPPVVREVKPAVQRYFPRPISAGDVLHSVDGEEVELMSRDDILHALRNFDGQLSFRSQKSMADLADLLGGLGDL
eukprot:s3579_g8.t1